MPNCGNKKVCSDYGKFICRLTCGNYIMEKSFTDKQQTKYVAKPKLPKR